MFSGRMAQSLDNYITGHYGEDQFRTGLPCDSCLCNEDCDVVEIKDPCPEFKTHHGSLTTPGPIHFGKSTQKRSKKYGQRVRQSA